MGLQARTKGLHLGADAERFSCEQVSLCLQLHSHESQHCGNMMHIPTRWTALQVFMTPRFTWLGRSRIACSLWPSRWYCPFPLHVFRRLKDVAVSTHVIAVSVFALQKCTRLSAQAFWSDTLHLQWL